MVTNTASNAVKECIQLMENVKPTAPLEVSHIFRLIFASNAPQLVLLALIFTLIIASRARIELLPLIVVNAKKNVQQAHSLIKGSVQMDRSVNQLMVVEFAPLLGSAMNVFLIIVGSLIANIKTLCLQHL